MGVPGGDLRRQLGLASATALVVGEVIGAGIFLTPAGMARSVGSPAWLLAVWLVMAGMAVSGALCFGELAGRHPEAGGNYVYLREAFGRRVAFLYGWKSLLVLDPGITAALAVGVAVYVDYLVGLPPAGRTAVALAAVALLAVTNCLGVKLGVGVLRVLTWAKLGLLALLVGWGFGFGPGDWNNFRPLVEQRPGSDPLPLALAGGLVAAFFSFGGWWDLGKMAGEVRDPARTVPRAMVLGVLVVTVAYILTASVFLYLVPLESVGSGEAFAARVGEVLFGPAGGKVLAAAVVVAVLGSLAVVLMVVPRVYYAMARDGLFPAAVARLHPRLGTPVRATAVQAVVAGVLVATGTFDDILGYFVFVTVAFLGLTATGLPVLRRRAGGAPAARHPGYPLTLAAFLGLTAVLLVLLVVGNPVGSLVGLGVVAAGVPVAVLVVRPATGTPVQQSANDPPAGRPAAP
ncbi:MAG: amino acid permease [Gemmataceae bacterium]|nr:amino acid permease [Gemmataceae bacterium]